MLSHQASAWTSVDSDLYYHMASLGHKDLIYIFTVFAFFSKYLSLLYVVLQLI